MRPYKGAHCVCFFTYIRVLIANEPANAAATIPRVAKPALRSRGFSSDEPCTILMIAGTPPITTTAILTIQKIRSISVFFVLVPPTPEGAAFSEYVC